MIVATRQRNREGGFTLIEVMIAMTLTAVAIMGIIALYVATTKASGASRHSTEAAVLAQDRLEVMRTTSPAVNGTLNEANINALGVAAAGIYQRSSTTTLTANYADLIVTVTWAEDSGTAATNATHTLVMRARRGL